MADMGQAMKAINAEVAGKAEGRLIAELVKSRLVNPPPRQIALIGFLQAQNCTTIPPVAWRHPEARHDVTDAGFTST